MLILSWLMNLLNNRYVWAILLVVASLFYVQHLRTSLSDAITSSKGYEATALQLSSNLEAYRASDKAKDSLLDTYRSKNKEITDSIATLQHKALQNKLSDKVYVVSHITQKDVTGGKDVKTVDVCRISDESFSLLTDAYKESNDSGSTSK